MQVVSHALAAAGVVCVEIFRQSRDPPESTLVFSRSETMHTLSMFIELLDWIRPTDGNYQLCRRIRKVIWRILDQVLEPVQYREVQVSVSGLSHLQITPQNQHNANIESMPMNDVEWMDWLNMADWSQSYWLNADFFPIRD
jgi:hypothetical protein